MRHHHCLYIIVFLSFSCLLLFGGCKDNIVDSTTNGKIEVGKSVDVGTQMISSAGGELVVNRPGDSLNGLTIHVNANAYPDNRTYHISYQPITSHNFGPDFHPISPLITISNGGGYSDQTMTIKIPIKLPKGYFAMAFLYDEKTGELEGMPLQALDSVSATIVTMNFDRSSLSSSSMKDRGKNNVTEEPEINSKIVMSAVAENRLTGDQNSNFLPGTDDFQFTNYGSYLEPNGHCSGQDVGAMFYFNTKKASLGKLYGKYDNDEVRKTPKIQEDDASAYKFCSMLQHDMSISSRLVNIGGYFLQTAGPGDLLTYYCFSYAILITKKPQLCFVMTNDILASKHALIVYRVTSNKIFIADPNWPGKTDRYAELVGDFFTPYHGTANARFGGESYPNIFYSATTSLFNWHSIESRWKEFENGKIGNGSFPDFSVRFMNDDVEFQALQDGDTLHRNTQFSVTGTGIFPMFQVYGQDQVPIVADLKGKVTLKSGKQYLGFAIGDKDQNWVGFKWFTVVVEGNDSSILPLTIGNKWIMKNTTYDSNGIARQIVTDTLIVTGKFQFGSDSVFRLDLSGQLYGLFHQTIEGINLSDGPSESHLFLKYPAGVSDTFATKTATVDKPPFEVVQFTKVVTTGKSVVVPKGTFKCYHYQPQYYKTDGTKVSEADLAELVLTRVVETNSFYAPGVGEVRSEHYVRLESGKRYLALTRELVDYTLK